MYSVKRTRFEPEATPAPARKRVKRESETPTINTTTSSWRQRTKQQTLTQIDFVKSSGSKGNGDVDDDTDLSELELLPFAHDDSARRSSSRRCQSRTPTVRNRSRTATRARAVVKKRDSTLTQMDFFRSGVEQQQEEEEQDGAGLADALIGGDDDENRQATIIHAFDGPADTDTRARTLRRGRSTPSAKRRAKTLTDSVPSVESKSLNDGQRRRKRRKLENADVADAGKERDAKCDTFVQTFGDNASRTTRMTKRSERSMVQSEENILPRSPVLEIQETKSSTNDSDLDTERAADTLLPPVTPVKHRDRVPSSQTPESIFPSTKKSRRRPLAEKSANIQMISPVKQRMKSSQVKLRSQQPSPKKKICVLKVPSRMHLPHSARVEDQQHDMWSMQATSSLCGKEDSPGDNDNVAEQHEIMETPSVRSTFAGRSEQSISFDTIGNAVKDQISIPETTTASGNPRADVVNMIQATNGSSAADLVRQRQISSADDVDAVGTTTVYDQDPVNMIPEYSEITTDELPDLGSPIPNETQFVRDLMERISTPIPKQYAKSSQPQRRPRSAKLTTSLPDPSLRRTPIPTPRLVHTSPFRMTQDGQSSKGTASFIAKPALKIRPLLQHGSSSVRITHVPLNDTNSYTHVKSLSSSSSPLLPPQPKADSMTQKSIYPASMPHPSQISTQAPSQLYVPTSSAPKSVAGQDSEIERITIKDSSSVPRRLSQYRGYTYGDGDHDLIEIRDSEQEDDLDIDLDPSSLQHPVSLGDRRQDRSNVTQETTYTQPGEAEDDDVTQTPTQKSRNRSSMLKRRPTTQSSPIVLKATTRSQRDAMLEVIALPSSSPPEAAEDEHGVRQFLDHYSIDVHTTPRPTRPSRSSSIPTLNSANGKLADRAPGRKEPTQQELQSQTRSEQRRRQQQQPPSSPTPSTSSSLGSSPSPRPLKRRYSPIPGFNNDTQSDLTQNGHISAAYVHRMREDGLPKEFIPQRTKPKGWRKGDSRNLLGSYTKKGKKGKK